MSATPFLLAILGASGVGKTLTRTRLLERDERFALIPAWTTRPARAAEIDRISVSAEAFEQHYCARDFLPENVVYGARYATPLAPIREALGAERYPLLDWPLSRVGQLRAAFPGRVFAVYLVPPSLAELGRRLAADGRDEDGERLRRSVAEIVRFEVEGLAAAVNLVVTTTRGREDAVAERIHRAFSARAGRELLCLSAGQ